MATPMPDMPTIPQRPPTSSTVRKQATTPRWWQSIRWRLALGSMLVAFLATALLALVGLTAPALALSRVKDLASIEGVRQNQLVGYGIVVGLNGTGDTLNNIPFTKQSLQAMLERMGVKPEILPTGCCGMAGSFGFEAEKYDWSMKIAEHALLPALRRAGNGARIIANGFSCREQIEQGSGRATQHLAETLAEAMRIPAADVPVATSRIAAAGLVAAGLLAGAALGRSMARRNAH